MKLYNGWKRGFPLDMYALYIQLLQIGRKVINVKRGRNSKDVSYYIIHLSYHPIYKNKFVAYLG